MLTVIMIMENTGLLAKLVFFSLAVIGVGMGLKNHHNYKKMKAKERDEQRYGEE